MKVLILTSSLFYALIPIFILISAFKTDNVQIRKNRICHAIPALVLTLINIGMFSYYFLTKKIFFISQDDFTFLIPGLLLLVTLIVWNAGRRYEKVIQMKITSEEIERVRFRKGDSSRQQITISSNDDEEML